MVFTRLARRLNARLMALTQSSDLINKRGIDAWRERIYSFTLRGLVVLGFLAALPSIWLSIQMQLFGLAIFDALAYLLVLSLIPMRNIAYRLRAMLLLFIGYSVGVVVFLATGEEGAGMFWLFAMPPLASLLLGLSGGIFFVGLNVFFVIGTTYLLMNNIPGLPELADFTFSGWLVVAVNFLVTNLIVTLPLGALLRGLVAVAESQKALEADYERLFNDNPIPMWVYDPDNLRFLQVNQAATVHYGYSRDEFLDMTIERIRPERELNRLAENLAEPRHSREHSGPWVHRKRDGSLIFVEIISHQTNFLGQPARLVQANDITKRLEAETQISRRLHELEAVREVSSDLRAVETVEEMLPLLLDATLGALESELGSIWLYDPLTDMVVIRASRGYGSEAEGTSRYPPERPGEGLAGYVFQSNQPHLNEDLRTEKRIPEEVRQIIPPGVGSVAVPIRADQSAIGVLIVNTILPREAGQHELNVMTTIAEIAGNAIQRTRLHQETRRHLSRTVSLVEVNRAINANLDLRLTLETVIGQVIEQLQVDAADVLLFNESLNQLEFAAGSGFVVPGFGHGLRLRPNSGFGGKVLAERKLVHMRGLPSEDMPDDFIADVNAEGFKTYVGVPLMAKGKLKGVLGIFHRQDLDPDLEWLSFLQSLASQASLAIDNASLVDDLQRSNLDLELAYDATIAGWSRAMDLRDRETEGHSQRVTEMALRLARRVGVKENTLIHLRRGALLHDIGKMGIPDEILHKPGPLTDAEWQGMRLHPVYARDMLGSIEYLQKALDIPYGHHEKWDGSGYPRGLKGEDIPLAARIFAVVDVYDALTSDRPYRKAWSRKKALEYIRKQGGQHFDPAVVEAFLAMVEGG